MIAILNKFCEYYFSKKSIEEILSTFINENTIIVCIGTPKVAGDSVGPCVGTILKNSNFCLPVYGTIEDPIHSSNLEEKISAIKKKHKKSRILAVDASITRIKENIGDIKCNVGHVSPGKGVKRKFKRKFRKIGQVYICGMTEYCDESMTFEEIVYKMIDTDIKLIGDIAETISTLIQRGYENNQNKKQKPINKIVMKISMIGR